MGRFKFLLIISITLLGLGQSNAIGPFLQRDSTRVRTKNILSVEVPEEVRQLWTLNPFWPLVPGNEWNFERSDNGHTLKISVMPQLKEFGCGKFPVHIYFEKKDADAYWGPSLENNLHWILGVNPNGDIRGFGHYVADLSGQLLAGTMNYRSMVSDIPAYLILRGNQKAFQYVSNRHALPSSELFTNSCLPDLDQYPSLWNVFWTRTAVSTPGYSGPAIKASFDEISGGRQIEDWYFAQGIGVVRIVVKDLDNKPIVDMSLRSYSLRDPNFLPNPTASSDILPEAQLTVAPANQFPSDEKILQVKVGEEILFQWNSGNASQVTSFVTHDADECTPWKEASPSEPWVAQSFAGAFAFTVQDCQAGKMYGYTVQATSATGNLSTSTVWIQVADRDPEPDPIVDISVGQTSDYAFVKRGDRIKFNWTLQNVAKVESFYFVNAPDGCSPAYTLRDTYKPWAVSEPSSGASEKIVEDCQSARSYTYVLLGYSPSGNKVARDQIILEVDGDVKDRMEVVGATLAQSWDVWSWWFNRFTGETVPNSSFFIPMMDESRRGFPLSIDEWWNCTQLKDCKAAIGILSIPVKIVPEKSFVVETIVEKKSYAVLKGTGFSPNGDNLVVSNCSGLQKTYDGEDGARENGIRQINVSVDTRPGPLECRFQVIRSDGMRSEEYKLLLSTNVENSTPYNEN